MSTRARTSKPVSAVSTVSTKTHTTEATMSKHAATNKTAATTQTESAPTAPPSPAPAGLPLVFLPPPPADAKIPVAPSGAVAPGGAAYRNLPPKSTELAALAGAVDDLKRFTTFAQVFGVTGLPYTQVVQAFDVGNQWSSMRKQTAAWDGFCETQEGISWGTIRAMMDRLRPLFEIAAAADPSLAVTFPSLAALFSAKSVIAHKAVATKRLNKAAIARGEQPNHGAVGKRRQKAADKAVVAAARAAASPGSPPLPTSTAPVPAAAAPATPTTPPASSPASNGAAHS
jgi:hypothetical protein